MILILGKNHWNLDGMGSMIGNFLIKLIFYEFGFNCI